MRLPASGTLRLLAAGSALAAVAGLAAACAPVPSQRDFYPGQSEGWSSTYADLRNSSSAPQELSDQPALRWSRDLGATAPGPAVFDRTNALRIATFSDQGCNMFSLSLTDGRKQWCARHAIVGPRLAPQVNNYGDTYWPIHHGAASMSGEGEYRWTTDLRTSSTTVRQLNGSQVLVVNTFGQARVMRTLHGTQAGPPLDLGGPVPGVPDDYGLPWCDTGTRGCPSPAPAALDSSGTRFYLTVWTLGAEQPDLVAVDVHTTASDDPATPADPDERDARAFLREAWRVPLEHGRTGAPVVLSADEQVAYVAAPGGLAAYSTADGTPRWFHDTGVDTDFAPAVTADGTIVMGGRTGTFYRGEDEEAAAARDAALAGGPVLALRDTGDAAEELWRAADAASLTAPVVTADGAALVASRASEDGVVLRAYGADGQVRWQTAVPDAHGPVAGLSLNTGSEIALVLSIGRLYLYAP